MARDDSPKIRRVALTWSSGRRFQADAPAGRSMTLDGDTEAGHSPMEALLSALGACMGIDVVIIIEKMRLTLDGLQIDVTGERAPAPPERFERVRLSFGFRGDIPRDKAERAVQLSLDKYCSVFHTLRPELEVSTSVEINS